MATVCDVCKKKIGFFDESREVAGLILCTSCYYEYYMVLKTIDDNEDFYESLRDFRQYLFDKENSEVLISHLKERYNEVLRERDQENVINTEEDDFEKREIVDEEDEGDAVNEFEQPGNFGDQDSNSIPRAKPGNSTTNKNGVNDNIGPFYCQDLVYSIEGVRGRHIDIYKNKIVINTRPTLGSWLSNNASDGGLCEIRTELNPASLSTLIFLSSAAGNDIAPNTPWS